MLIAYTWEKLMRKLLWACSPWFPCLVWDVAGDLPNKAQVSSIRGTPVMGSLPFIIELKGRKGIETISARKGIEGGGWPAKLHAGEKPREKELRNLVHVMSLVTWESTISVSWINRSCTAGIP